MEIVLNTYGLSLSRDNEGFVITSDGTRQRVPPDGVTSIIINKGAQITSDAIFLAVEKEIEILFVDKGGTPLGRVWSPRFGSISTIRKGQLKFICTHSAVSWIKDIICRKIENQQALLLAISADMQHLQDSIQKSVHRLEDYRTKISNLDGLSVNEVAFTLRGWEGQSSRIYFETFNLLLPDEYRFVTRSQHPATDIANAMLNYGYGMLYGKVEGALIKAGIDPYIGVLHRDDYNRPVLVYDVIELYRVWVDYVVCTILSKKAMFEECYSVRDDGSVWLEGLGRRILIQSLNDYLEEVVTINGVSRSRDTHITLYAQNLAQQLKHYER